MRGGREEEEEEEGCARCGLVLGGAGGDRKYR